MLSDYPLIELPVGFRLLTFLCVKRVMQHFVRKAGFFCRLVHCLSELREKSVAFWGQSETPSFSRVEQVLCCVWTRVFSLSWMFEMLFNDQCTNLAKGKHQHITGPWINHLPEIYGRFLFFHVNRLWWKCGWGGGDRLLQNMSFEELQLQEVMRQRCKFGDGVCLRNSTRSSVS